MPVFPRSWLLPSATVAYVAFASWSQAVGPWRWVALLALPPLVATLWQRIERLQKTALVPTAIPAVQAVIWGMALYLAARAGPSGRAAFDAAANLGAGMCTVATLIALADLKGPAGLLIGHRAARSRDAAAFAALLWSIAVTLPSARALLPGTLAVDPLAIDYATSAAAIGSTLLLTASSGRIVLLRGLVLGVGDRARGALTLALTGALVAICAALVDVAPPDRTLPTVLTGTALAVTWTCATRDPASVSAALRGLLAVILLGVPSALLTLWWARRTPDALAFVVLTGSAASLIAGLIARSVSRPLGPESSRWIEAMHSAMERALLPEPEAALSSALTELCRAEPMAQARPELWRRDPPAVLSVDIAGYLHETPMDFPERILELAQAEPERTLRAETLAELEVRRPDLRPLFGWFESHHALTATALVDADGPVGLLVMPRGMRQALLTLEEVRSLRELGDRVTGLLSVSSAMARSRKRELDARKHAEQLESERNRLAITLEAERQGRIAEAESFADPLRRTAHGPSSRMAIQELEALALSSPRIQLLAPPGVDARAWAAVAHLASPRRIGSFVLVDCAASSARDLETWRDPHGSPLWRSSGGTLVLEDPAALPEAVQLELARLLPEHKGGLVVSSQISLEAAQAQSTLQPSLAARLKAPSLTLPSIVDRAEDLKSLILFELAAAGLRLRGEPLGIDEAALYLLTEHTFPGNDRELRGLLYSAATRATGPRVTADDLDLTTPITPAPEHLTPSTKELTPSEPPLEAHQRRRRARRAPRSRSYP